MHKVKLNRYNKKFYYKLEILYNKYAPAFVALMITIDDYLDLQNTFIHSFTYLCVPSVLTLGHMYLSRSILGFCRLHRIIVDYVLFNVFYRMWQVIPFLPQFDKSTWHIIYSITFILGVLIFIYSYATDNKEITTTNNR